jgi:hypothetical protein
MEYLTLIWPMTSSTPWHRCLELKQNLIVFSRIFIPVFYVNYYNFVSCGLFFACICLIVASFFLHVSALV